MYSKFHTKISEGISDASTWAALSGPLAALATQIPEPWSYGAYAIAAGVTLVGILLKGGERTP